MGLLPLILRTLVLRVLLASVLSCLASSVACRLQNPWGLSLDMGFTMYAPPVFILLHHIFRLWAPSWWRGICEALCCLVDIGSSAFTIYYLWAKWTISLDPRFSADLALAASWFVLSGSVLAAFSILLWDIWIDRGRRLLQQYDFSAGLGPGRPDCQWGFIFGTFTTRKRFNTDNRLIRWIRGGLAIICLVVLSLMAFYVLLGKPLWQRGRTVSKISRVPVNLLSSDELATQFLWETIVIVDVSDMQGLQEDPPKPFMSIVGGFAPLSDTTTINSGMDPVGPRQVTECYSNGNWSQNQMCYSDTRSLFNGSFVHLSDLRSSEILITIDFSAFGTTADQTPFQVGVYPGVSNSTTTFNTKPIYLGPGSHVYAASYVSLREQSLNQGFAILGIPNYHLFPVLNVGYLFPDLSPPPQNNTASLRLFFPQQDEVQIEREYFESSLLDGFALLGGVWTFINGLFATVFGCTLLLVLFGIKPLSIYGLIHLVQPKGSLVHRDHTLSQEDRDWILAILSEHLLDDGIKASRKLQFNASLVRSMSRDRRREIAEAEHLVEQGSVESV